MVNVKKRTENEIRSLPLEESSMEFIEAEPPFRY